MILILALWLIPEWQACYFSKYVPKEKFPLLANEYRKTIAQIIGGFLLLVGLYLNLRRIKAVEREVKSSEEGQITERFTRAIEQLGSEKMAIRLGGIYALERLSKDSKKDHWTVMEVLTAFIRENAPWKTEEAEGQESESFKQEEVEGFAISAPQKPPHPKTDIQATLSVICRRTRNDIESGTIDLKRTDLRGYNLSGGSLEKANLFRSHLEYAYLKDACLKGASLWMAHLGSAVLLNANLESADLDLAHLEGADLRRANLSSATLNEAHLERAKMHHANFSGAELGGAHMQRARLHRAKLDGAVLDSAFLDGAVINEASLIKADLSFAKLNDVTFADSDLSEAILMGAELEGAKFHRAKLVGTNLMATNLQSAIGLTRDQIKLASTNEETRLPDSLKGQ